MKRLATNSDAARDLASGRYRIRKLDAGGLAAVPIPWMRDAGWNPGLHDAETFITADPDGFLVGELDGQPIAAVSGVRYDDTFGFLGCYIVLEPFRGRGYGMAIHEAARQHLEGCTQGGDGVLENVEKYKQIGRVYAYRNARYEGVKQATNWNPAKPLHDACEVSLEQIEALDRMCFPAPRSAFLKAWLHQPDAFALAAAEAGNSASGAVRGYGVIRKCSRGWKIGPLFAQDADTADDLFRGLVERIPTGDSFVLDIAEPNDGAKALVARYGMREVFATARMYTGPFPQVRLDWVYGVTTFELG
ncbi:acetyltransferase (GNAT) family protein [Roseimicrobium gellanilyticum]|uniref:Acetyltransferase (GNAT) family protein n=1 Tax=Roseimicrobium gellanilyticum TaxID=748857 RepID=A0A366HS18_9BACT|nr:GNAT family N-acetyltransferase [Roseimicrobium gellanilyticum]RBP45888.1 acetyltransferase (GNAT) family protein [Roseimicrobium gellanilyticum]